MMVGEYVGGLESGGPEEDEKVHGTFEAAGCESKGEDLLVDCSLVNWMIPSGYQDRDDKPPSSILRVSFVVVVFWLELPLSP